MLIQHSFSPMMPSFISPVHTAKQPIEVTSLKSPQPKQRKNNEEHIPNENNAKSIHNEETCIKAIQAGSAMDEEDVSGHDDDDDEEEEEVTTHEQECKEELVLVA